MSAFASMKKSEIVIIVLAVLYVLSPVDMIPEIIAGPLGLTDDAAAIAVASALFLAARNRSKDPVVVEPVSATFEAADDDAVAAALAPPESFAGLDPLDAGAPDGTDDPDPSALSADLSAGLSPDLAVAAAVDFLRASRESVR
jgi:uncharacterized membrane protein YkvA (DUF1232 family)